MAVRDREVCEHCGHQFRTGLGTGLGASSVDAPLMDEASLHRTMQFTLPPLVPRGGAATPEADSAADRPRRRIAPAMIVAGVVLGLACALAYFHYAQTDRAAKPSPAGVWETAPADRASQSARLRLTLGADGGGAFSWEAGGAPPLPAPLRWRLDPDGRLILTITPPPPDAADAVPGTLITVLDSRPWLWRVDRPRHRLIIGTLSFTEKT